MAWRLSIDDKTLILMALYAGASYKESLADAYAGCTDPSDVKAREDTVATARRMRALAKRLRGHP
jgi:hypothetical protein